MQVCFVKLCLQVMYLPKEDPLGSNVGKVWQSFVNLKIAQIIHPWLSPYNNPYVRILEYWKDISVLYPILANATLQLLCISIGSVDAEHSFNKVWTLQHSNHSSMNPCKTLCMQMTLYFNQDLKGQISHYCFVCMFCTFLHISSKWTIIMTWISARLKG